jgi:putative pyruvate formate lyase activating enzyme
VVIHLHSIVDAIVLLGRGFMPSREELARARRTKAHRFFLFDDLPEAASYDGAFNAPMLWNSNFFITPIISSGSRAPSSEVSAGCHATDRRATRL